MRSHLLMLSKRMVQYCPFLASEVTLQESFSGSSSGGGNYLQRRSGVKSFFDPIANWRGRLPVGLRCTHVNRDGLGVITQIVWLEHSINLLAYLPLHS